MLEAMEAMKTEWFSVDVCGNVVVVNLTRSNSERVEKAFSDLYQIEGVDKDLVFQEVYDEGGVFIIHTKQVVDSVSAVLENSGFRPSVRH